MNRPLALLELEGRELYANFTIIKEQEFQTWVENFARAYDWLCYHTYRPLRSPAGFPDLVLLRPPLVLFIELKTEAKASILSAAQHEWVEGLQRCGLEAEVWRPRDIPKIIERLKATWNPASTS